MFCHFFVFKQKTAYEMRISDWSSDVCSSDLPDIAIKALRIGHTGPRFNAKIMRTGLLPKTQPRGVGKGNIQQWMTRRAPFQAATVEIDRKSTRLNSSH